MFLVRDLHADHLKAYRPLVIGQAALTFSMVTDVMDELVDMPEPYNMVFEGFLKSRVSPFSCWVCADGSFTTRP